MSSCIDFVCSEGRGKASRDRLTLRVAYETAVRPREAWGGYSGQSGNHRVPGLRRAPLPALAVDPGPRAGRSPRPLVWPASSVFTLFSGWEKSERARPDTTAVEFQTRCPEPESP